MCLVDNHNSDVYRRRLNNLEMHKFVIDPPSVQANYRILRSKVPVCHPNLAQRHSAVKGCTAGRENNRTSARWERQLLRRAFHFRRGRAPDDTFCRWQSHMIRREPCSNEVSARAMVPRFALWLVASANLFTIFKPQTPLIRASSHRWSLSLCGKQIARLISSRGKYQFCVTQLQFDSCQLFASIKSSLISWHFSRDPASARTRHQLSTRMAQWRTE